MQQEELLARVNELPQIKKVLQELVEMVNQKEVDFDELSQKIALEQVVSAKILRMANSAYFGGSRSVASVDQAVVRLGIGPIKTMVVSSVVSSVFPKFETLDIEQYWADTFEVATIAGHLARKVNLDPNLAFTAGVLHNIGELMIHSLAPSAAKEILSLIDQGASPSKAQLQVIGTTATVLGAKLAAAWKFDPELTDSIANFLSPSRAEVNKKLAILLYLSFVINRDWESIDGEESQSSYLENNKAARVLGITSQEAQGIDEVIGKGREIAAQMVG